MRSDLAGSVRLGPPLRAQRRLEALMCSRMALAAVTGRSGANMLKLLIAPSISDGSASICGELGSVSGLTEHFLEKPGELFCF